MADRSQKAISDFVSEAQETIDALGKDLMRLEAHGEEPDPDLLNSVFRGAHSLKGLSSMFGVERMARLAHALEDLLDDARMGRRLLDRGAMDLLLEAPEVFSRIIAEEADGTAPTTQDAAARLTDRLRAGDQASAVTAEDPLDAVAIGPDLRKVLTEYEEHRLRANVLKGLELYRIRVAFDLAAFDSELSALTTRLKALGEVVSTLPSSDVHDPATIAFELLFASAEPPPAVALEAGPSAAVEAVARLRPVVAAAPARAPASAQAPPLPSGVRGAPSTSVGDPPLPSGERAGVRGPAARAPASTPATSTPVPSVLPMPEEAGVVAAAPVAPAVLSPAPEAPAEGDAGTLRSASQAVRVDIHKLDRLMNVVGELVLVKSSLQAIAERLKAEGGDPVLTAELHRANRGLERKLDELQSGILEVRMVPLDQVFDKLTRMVRKIAREVGKEVDFEVSGGDVELDKLIVEDLSDPLMHLIRNAIDHAVEPPEARELVGKPRAGRVTLTATQRGNKVKILVADDGAGIDEARVREVAVARGLARPEEVAAMGRREVLNLIFVPGFSTARQVTSLSGRGVGMDVVKQNVAALRGTIDVESTVGAGSTVRIRLPLTLAIIDGFMVGVAGATYIVPLDRVVECVELPVGKNSRDCMDLRGEVLPFIRLRQLFNAFGQRPRRESVVVVEYAGMKVGLVVDSLMGEYQTVIKPLGRLFSHVQGIGGSTIMGNGDIALIIDVPMLIRPYGDRSGSAAAVGVSA